MNEAEEHEAIRELISGYSLHALGEEDARAAKQALAVHVPACPECQRLLETFQSVAGELALVAGSRTPPRLLSARLKRDVKPSRRPAWLPGAAAAVAVALVAGLALWNARLVGRVGLADVRQARTADLLRAVSHPTSHVVPLAAELADWTAKPPPTTVQLAAAFVPGRPEVFLFGSMPKPREHRVYQIWVLQAGQFNSVGTFLPEGGQVLIRIRVDPASIQGLLVTEEAEDGSDQPSDRHVGTASL